MGDPQKIRCRANRHREIVVGPSNVVPGAIYVGTCVNEGCDQVGAHLAPNEVRELIKALRREVGDESQRYIERCAKLERRLAAVGAAIDPKRDNERE